eukprot:SAG22_NODE_17279_length_308_cov_0.712919_1_plen_67_part_10
MNQGPETMRENAFIQTYGRDLQEALKWCDSYGRTRRDTDLNQVSKALSFCCASTVFLSKTVPFLVDR